ncbi:hypothetical protein [Faucicola boevrei]|uniref:hypothetical protein n=1 Tax=Faucicola boevrei TaxID=346665 RepID=UPI0003692E97|nr:hypothetical protein [Moraxella boevrei]
MTKYIYSYLIIFTSSLLVIGCTSTFVVLPQQMVVSNQLPSASVSPNKKSPKGFLPADYYDPKTCHPKFVDGLIDEKPIYRGVPADRFVELMPIQIFRAKLKSSLGSHYTAQSFDTDEFTLTKLHGSLYVRSNKYHVLKIYYTTSYDKGKFKYGQKLFPEEKFAMTELINIFVDDKAKSDQILQQLYQQYMTKVKNHEVLDDNESVFTYLEYDGKIFGLSGLQRINHPLPHCDIELLSGLTIE